MKRNAIKLLVVITSMFAISSLLSVHAATIRGKVVDTVRMPIEGVAVVARSLPDSLYIGGTMTDSIGQFAINAEMPQSGNVLITAEGIGYESTSATTDGSQSVTLTLEAKELGLGEVVVKAPKMTVSPGKMTFFPGDLVNKVNNAFEVMKYVPMVTVDNRNDEISVLGEATKVYVNGRPSIMTPNGVMQMLKGSDAPRIKKIEVWLQPGIAYQGEGIIVNLQLAPRTGFVNTTDVTQTVGDNLYSRLQSFNNGEWERWQFAASVSAQYSKDKNNYRSIYTAYDQSDDENDNSQLIDFEKTTYANTKSHHPLITADLGVSYDLGHRNYLGVTAFAWFRADDRTSTNRNHYDNGMEDYVTSHTKSSFHPEWVVARANYDQTLDTLNSKFRATLLYQGMFSKSRTEFLPVEMVKAYRSHSSVDQLNLKADWIKRFASKFSTDLGVDIFNDNVSSKRRDSANGQLTDTLCLADNLSQKQLSMDMFVSADYRFSQVFALSAGVRGRWYRRSIEQFVQPEKYRFEDGYLLPNVMASLSLNANHSMTLGYSKSVQQPGYGDTNPIETWFSNVAYSKGNPTLKAMNVNSINFRYFLLQKFNIGMTASFRDNLSAWVTLPEENGITLQTPIEFGKDNNMRFNVGYSANFFNYRLSIYANVNYELTHRSFSELASFKGEPSETVGNWNGYASASLALGRDRSWGVELNGNYRSRIHNAFSTNGAIGDISFEASKKFKWGGLLYVCFGNLLNSKRCSWFDSQLYSQRNYWDNNTRYVMVKFDITFGKHFRMRSNATGAEHHVD